ncbi:SRR1-like protein [Megalops cyprinoides]|uniref:SRR1-like protein n=1 Tax=Megalops cyprinoides TaxID=118141 RepID=UPI001863BBBB|nr:SRR1-like protein [Megalops cyprinoides]
MILRCEDFWLEWKELLSRCLATESVSSLEGDCDPSSTGLDCVCYGLGSFSSCISSRYQLAMLLLLLDTLRIPPSHCSVFDPVFTPVECEVLKTLGFTVLSENEEGKRAASRPTLFYLMHCGKALYNNLLWKNWSLQALPRLTILGNSFRGIQERMVQRELQRDYSFIADVLSACEETALPCSPRFLDVFNDTALLRFLPQRLNSLPPHTWTDPPEPQYLHCEDLEIIQRDQGS